MDAELLGGRLAATEAALLKIDERLDELIGRVDAWTQQQSLNSTADNQIVELAAEVAIAEAEARAAEASALEALAVAEAAEAELEATALEALNSEPEPEPVVEAPTLEV